MKYFFILDEHGNPIPATNQSEWSDWMFGDDGSEKRRRVLKQTHVGPLTVSTVFLGINHRFFGDGPPVLWETMVFGDDLDQHQERYCSREDAYAGHRRWVEKCKEMVAEAAKTVAGKTVAGKAKT